MNSEDADAEKVALNAPGGYVTQSENTMVGGTLQRYDELLEASRREDLSSVSGIGCLYRCGSDRCDRPVLCFIGKWFHFSQINRHKAVLYLIQLLDSVGNADYTIVYFHTATSLDNHPSLGWMRQVYGVLEYHLRKNLKAFYIVHPTIWTRMAVWTFATFCAKAVKKKIHNVSGLEYLYDVISPKELEIPAFITEHDMRVNGLGYHSSAGYGTNSGV